MTSLPFLGTRDHPRFCLSGSCCSIFFILCRVLWITVCLIFYYSIIRPSSIDGFWLPFINIVNPHLMNETVFVLTISADIRNARHWSTLFACFTLFVSSHDLQCYTVYWYHFASVHCLLSVVTIAHIYNLSWNHLINSK